MSSLTFRERLVVAYCSIPADPTNCSPEFVIEAAQRVADACCAKWGHDFSHRTIIDHGSYEVEATECARCGAEPETAKESTP